MVEYSEILDGPSCIRCGNHPRYAAICVAVNRRPWGILKDGSAEDLPEPDGCSSTEIDYALMYDWSKWHG